MSTLTNFVYNADNKLTFGAGNSGEYIELVLPKSVDASKFLIGKMTVKTDNGKEVGFVLASEDDKSTYKMHFATKYGYAPAQYSDAKYIFLLFDKDGNFINAAEVFNAKEGSVSAIYYAREYLKDNKWNKASETYGEDALSATILVMGNYQLISGENVKNIHHLQGTLTIDLNGNTITSYGYQAMFNSEMNQWTNSGDESIFPTEVIVKNGRIVNGSFPIIAFTAKKADKEFTYKFEDVTFSIEGDMSARMSSFVQYGTETVKVNSAIEFNNCIFDITKSTAKKAITLFGIGNEYYNISVTVNGGSIIAGNKLFSCSNETAGTGTLTFGAYNGKYTTLSISPDSAAPTERFNNGTLCFVKTSATETQTAYTVASAKITDYVPKMSVTLDTDLIINVYIPVAGTKSFVLSGVEYNELDKLSDFKVEIDGTEYYKMSVDLKAYEAASTVTLVAKVDFGSGTSSGTFTFGIIKYAKKVIGDNDSYEATLVKDILSYIRAAYDYFGKSDDAAMADISAILGENYDVNNEPVLNGSADDPTVGLTGVTFVLNSTPAIRFYIAADADPDNYRFYADGKYLPATAGNDVNGTYVEISVYAYLMGKTVTYTVNGVESGSYHIRSYYEFAKTQDDAKLVTLVERFARYCESAENYRISVTEN